jgi:hypothetical protein
MALSPAEATALAQEAFAPISLPTFEFRCSVEIPSLDRDAVLGAIEKAVLFAKYTVAVALGVITPMDEVEEKTAAVESMRAKLNAAGANLPDFKCCILNPRFRISAVEDGTYHLTVSIVMPVNVNV